MKNSLPSVLLLLPILVISLGMYAYTSSQSTIIDSMNNMSTAEIEAFNSQFTMYGGVQTGATLKSLMGSLSANANTYSLEPDKIPGVTAEIIDSDSNDEEGQDITTIEAKTPEEGGEEIVQKYINEIAKIRNSLETKKSYNVSFEYSNKGVLNKIIIER